MSCFFCLSWATLSKVVISNNGITNPVRDVLTYGVNGYFTDCSYISKPCIQLAKHVRSLHVKTLNDVYLFHI